MNWVHTRWLQWWWEADIYKFIPKIVYYSYSIVFYSIVIINEPWNSIYWASKKEENNRCWNEKSRKFSNNVVRFWDNPINVKSASIISKGIGNKTNTDGRIPNENQITTRLWNSQSMANHTKKYIYYYNVHRVPSPSVTLCWPRNLIKSC